MHINIHIFVFVASIIFYVLLYNLISYEKNRKQKKLNLIYILFIPTILYICYYYYAENELLFSFLNEPVNIATNNMSSNMTSSMSSNTELMNTPFPSTSDSSFF